MSGAVNLGQLAGPGWQPTNVATTWNELGGAQSTLETAMQQPRPQATTMKANRAIAVQRSALRALLWRIESDQIRSG